MSSDQQYPYAPDEPRPDPDGRHRQPQQANPYPYQYPHEPQAAPDGGYGGYVGYGAQGQDMEATQVWQGQTWDTGTQPVLEGHQGHHGHHPAAPEPGQPYAAGGPQVSAMEETAYVPVQGAPPAPAPDPGSGAYPLPPEMPTPGRAMPPQGYAQPQQQTRAPAPGGYPQHGTGGQAAPEYPAAAYAAPATATAQAQAPATPAPAAAAPSPGATQGGASQGGASHADGYGVPTTLGTARVTDAQRARAEGRSPIIPPGAQPAGLTAVLALLLAGGAALGSYALLVPVVILQAVTAAGWFRLNGMWPARQGIALAFLGGLVSDIALLAAGKSHAPAAIIGTLGVWVLLTVVLQLRSHADPDTRLTGLLATVVSAALAIIATGHLAAPSDAVVVGAVAVAAATLVRALPLPGPASIAAALVAAAVVGAAMGGLTGFGAAGALAVGLGAGACALIGLRAASYDYPSRFVHMTAGVALPLTAAAPAVYLLGRAFG
ncbi:hypothetical protein [Streptomyces sp. NRRL F-5126]|uniref:hypothetical protein n=1 Tax=Streptomyces sp. NRRL F-5126 TaxID=1463857 RepID=UPI0004C92314|nr:hypothetical protein [Streptomyces sp. NRRL F-5126]